MTIAVARTATACTTPRLNAAWAGALVVLATLAIAFPATAAAEQASQPGSLAAAQLDSGRNHTCALLPGGSVRCWGFNREGELGYGNQATVGDNETPGSAGPVSLGEGRSATAISAGDFHTCALLDDGSVRCWGFGGDGRLGLGIPANVGDDETPGSVPAVNLGPNNKAKAISAGGAHTCALLVDNTLRCWGFGFDGRLGYANTSTIGDDETPAAVGAVNVGGTPTAISAGDFHTCALLIDASVRCWGFGSNGQLGYGDVNLIGDDEVPAAAGPVNLGGGAKAISAGGAETCAVLSDGAVRCWGFGGNGRLGYGDSRPIGDDETPNLAGPVNLGGPATAISVGDGSVCARLESAAVRCWGFGGDGRLGYGGTVSIGDDELPGSAGPVDLGMGRTAKAVSLGGRHACVRLDEDNVRCWGYGGNGRLGYCNERNVGDDEAPSSAGPVALGVPGAAGAPCAPAGPGPAPPPPPPVGRGAGTPPPRSYPRPGAYPVDPRVAERRRAGQFRSCIRKATRHARAERTRARRGSARKRAHARRNLRRARRGSARKRARARRNLRRARRNLGRARRHLRRHLKRARRACVKRHGRKPGRVTGLSARAISKRKVVLSFNAPGSDGSRPPAARTYLIKQSLRPIRGARRFRRAQSLCEGTCRFPTITKVGGRITLNVTALRPRTTYYYAVAARDNVSRRLGRRSTAVKVRTR